MKSAWVKAAPLKDAGLAGQAKVCREESPHRYITEKLPVLVNLTGYYLRKLRSGELVTVTQDHDKQETEA